jgi:perosamine synthetase
MHAALGLAQLNRIEDLLGKRESAAASYQEALQGVLGLITPRRIPGSRRSWFVYVVQLPSKNGSGIRDTALRSLRSAGIGCQAYFPVIHRQPYMKGQFLAPFGNLREAEIASDTCLAIPFFSTIDGAQISAVCQALKQALPAATMDDHSTARIAVARS